MCGIPWLWVGCVSHFLVISGLCVALPGDGWAMCVITWLWVGYVCHYLVVGGLCVSLPDNIEGLYAALPSSDRLCWPVALRPCHDQVTEFTFLEPVVEASYDEGL